MCSSLSQRHDKLKYFTDLTDKICSDDKNMKGILFVLVQNSLFGDNGLCVEEIQTISNLSASKIRSCLKLLDDKVLLRIEKDSRRKLYDIDLDKMSKFES